MALMIVAAVLAVLALLALGAWSFVKKQRRARRMAERRSRHEENDRLWKQTQLRLSLDRKPRRLEFHGESEE